MSDHKQVTWATCSICKREMSTNNEGCVQLYYGPRKLPAIPHEAEAQYGFSPEDGIPCHDCGVKYGKLHHHGCDMEHCPSCGDQAGFCDCTISTTP